MGNIFKTLGLDDLARSIPIIGNAAGDFLGGINMGQTSGPGAGGPNFLSQLGPNKSRISNEDYQHNQNLLNSSNPQEASRQNEFLRMVTPTNADMYNEYQDATQPEDTQRQINNIKSKSEALGMSPWEITGSGGSTPLPAPQSGPQQSKGDGSSFLSALAPLKIAELNNKTALQQTKMQTDTQKYVADQSTNKGELPKQQTLKAAAETVTEAFRPGNISADTGLKTSQSAVAENSIVLNSIATILSALPTTNIDLGMFKSQSREGYQQVLGMIKGYDQQGLSAAIEKGINAMPPPQFDQFSKDMVKLATMIGSGAKGAMNTVSSLEGLWLTIKNMLGGR